MKELHCSSCKVRIANMEGTVQFKCPKCGKTDIIRCKHCRALSATYSCPACKFSGPN